MKTSDSNEIKSKPEKKPALRLVAYGLAMVEMLVASTVRTFEKSLRAVATKNSSVRDVSPICKTGRERFVWAHGFICGVALGTGIFTIGLSITLWITIS